MHFIRKIIENPKLENPAREHMDIHRHFYRYSKGIFLGPAIKLYRSKTKISLKGSLEYEDIIEELVLRTVPGEKVKVTGNLYAAGDITEMLQEMGVNWEVQESSGKTKNYKADIDDEINKNLLIDVIKELRSSSYLLLNFTINNACKVKSKKRLPQPSKKKPADDDLSKRVNFITGYIENTDTNSKMIEDELLYDFKDDLPEDWKRITVTNNYRITDIILPDKKEKLNSYMMRVMAIRKGKLIRTAEIDGDTVEKQYNIVA